MASPSNKKGQRRGLCGYIMTSFHLHKRCARCRKKGIGDDDCVEVGPVLFAMALLKFKRKSWLPQLTNCAKKRKWVC